MRRARTCANKIHIIRVVEKTSFDAQHFLVKLASKSISLQRRTLLDTAAAILGIAAVHDPSISRAGDVMLAGRMI